jgi:hypothetical protein
MMTTNSLFSLLLLQTIASLAFCFRNIRQIPRRADPSPPRRLAVSATGRKNGGGDEMTSDVDEYRNAPTAFLSNFMQKTAPATSGGDPLADIDFDGPKISKVKLETLAAMLDYELCEREWFVTGLVDPSYFDPSFAFEDPDVKLTGIEEYARGVRRLFDQATSRAEIISCVVNSTVPNTITVTWRLSGRVNIGPGLPIKPYICYTDFTVDEGSGLVTKQEDRFDVPGWDILLSALFPFLIGRITKAPAPEVKPRVVTMPASAVGAKKGGGGIFDGLLKQVGFGLAELFEGV